MEVYLIDVNKTVEESARAKGEAIYKKAKAVDIYPTQDKNITGATVIDTGVMDGDEFEYFNIITTEELTEEQATFLASYMAVLLEYATVRKEEDAK